MKRLIKRNNIDNLKNKSLQNKLIKKSKMDENMFENVIDQASSKGRKILQILEDFKFTLDQTARLLKNNQELAQGFARKRKAIDEISNKLYQIVYDIENIDISQAFYNDNSQAIQDAPVSTTEAPDKSNDNTNEDNNTSPEKVRDVEKPDIENPNIQQSEEPSTEEK